MLGTRSQRYSMNWPYWSGLISAMVSGARAILMTVFAPFAVAACSAPGPPFATGSPKRAAKKMAIPVLAVTMVLLLARFLPAGQGLEAVQVLSFAHGDEDVTGFERRIMRRVEDHLPGSLLDGDDDDAQVLAEPAVLERRARQRTLRRNLGLLDLQVGMLDPGGQLNKVHDGGPQDSLGDAAAPNLVRGHDPVGAGAKQFLIGARLLGASDDEQPIVQEPRTHGDIEIVRIGAGQGDEGTSAVDAGAFQNVVRGGIAVQGQAVRQLEIFQRLALAFDDDKGASFPGEFLADQAAHAAVAADDQVMAQLRQAAFHLLPPQDDANLTADHGTDELRGRVKKDKHAAQAQEHRENPS